MDQARQRLPARAVVILKLFLAAHLPSSDSNVLWHRLRLAMVVEHVHLLVDLAVVDATRVVLVRLGALNLLLLLLWYGYLSRNGMMSMVMAGIDGALSIVAIIVVQHRARVEFAHAAKAMEVTDVASRAGRSMARAASSIILIVPWGSSADNHLGRLSVGYLDPVLSANGSNVGPELDDQVVVLLCRPSLAIVLGGLLKLDALKGTLSLRSVACTLGRGPSIRIVQVSAVMGQGRIARVNADVAVGARVWLGHERNSGRVLRGTLVPLGRVLNQLNGVLVTVGYDGGDAHGEALDSRSLGSRGCRRSVFKRNPRVVWGDAIVADAGEVVPAVASPLAVGLEETLVDASVDADLSGSPGGVLVVERA